MKNKQNKFIHFILFYFSGTGNTWWVSKEFSDMIYDSGNTIQLIFVNENFDSEKFWKDLIVKIQKEVNISPKKVIIGFGYPVYGAALPPLMYRFIKTLLEKKSRICPNKEFQCFSISTVGFVNGFGPIRFKKLFHNNKMQLMWAGLFRLGNNMSTPKLKIHVSSPSHVEKKKKKIRIKLKKFVRTILQGKKSYQGVGPWLIAGGIIKKLLKKRISENYRNMSVDLKRCIKCFCCINSCPTESIEYKEERFHFNQTCTACIRCYTYCPTNAILLNAKFVDPSIYPRYKLPNSDFKNIFWLKNN